MNKINFISLGELPTFNISTEDPNWPVARLSWEISAMLRQAALAGVSIDKPEESDTEDLQSALTDILANVGDYFDGVFQADGQGEETDTMPSIPEIWPVIIPFIPLILSAGFNPGGFFVLCVAVGLGVVLHWVKSKGEQKGKQFDPADDETMGEIKELMTAMLEEMKLANTREECMKLADDTIVLWKSKVLRGLA